MVYWMYLRFGRGIRSEMQERAGRKGQGDLYDFHEKGHSVFGLYIGKRAAV